MQASIFRANVLKPGLANIEVHSCAVLTLFGPVHQHATSDNVVAGFDSHCLEMLLITGRYVAYYGTWYTLSMVVAKNMVQSIIMLNIGTTVALLS